MKLYATIENTRGKKEGVGDDEDLDIEVRAGNKLIIRLLVSRDENIYRASLKTSDAVLLDKIGDIKGKSKCPECKYNKDEMIIGCGVHYREAQKGKSQKGGECIHDWDNYGKCCNCGKWNT